MSALITSAHLRIANVMRQQSMKVFVRDVVQCERRERTFWAAHIEHDPRQRHSRPTSRICHSARVGIACRRMRTLRTSQGARQASESDEAARTHVRGAYGVPRLARKPESSPASVPRRSAAVGSGCGTVSHRMPSRGTSFTFLLITLRISSSK